jgi:hypothetical protein
MQQIQKYRLNSLLIVQIQLFILFFKI